MMYKQFMATACIACLVLSGCGGGGGGGGSSSSGGGAMIAGSGTGGSTVTSPSADPISKYLGTYSTACTPDLAAYDASTGATIYSTSTSMMPLKSSATQAPMQVVVKFYDTPDCSGTERLRITRQGPSDFLRLDGTVVINGQTVDKITQGFGGFLPGANGTAVTEGGLLLSGSYVVGPTTFKNLTVLNADGTSYSGDYSQALDAQGYPSALRSVADPSRHSS